MSDLNCIIVEGRLTKSAELGHWTDGSAYCNFSIANNETYKNQNGEYESIASYFDCAMKGKYAESMSKHLIKGRGVKVVGRLKQQRWEKDGQKFSRVIIKVNELHLNPVTNSDNAGYQQTPAQQSYSPESEYIPFDTGAIDDATNNAMGDIPF